MSTTTREVHLAARPHGMPTEDDFRVVAVELPEPADGQVLVRNLAMSVDPYMRGRMSDVPSYAPPWQLDHPATGGAVGEVVESAAPGLAVGTLVLHQSGWREHALVSESDVRPVEPSPGISPSLFLGVLGMTGLTAYAGLFRVAEFRPGDTVFVSAAAGAVGSVVGQLARLHGAERVIGSAGSGRKVRFLLDALGFDAAFDYHDGPVDEQLRAAAPQGIDVYFDNVGGEHLQAAISSLKLFGRAALCGSISGYNATERPPGPNNLSLVTGKRLTLRGFLVSDHTDLSAEFQRSVAAALASGDLLARETVVQGLDQAVPAFVGMLRGENIGKTVVRLAELSESPPPRRGPLPGQPAGG